MKKVVLVGNPNVGKTSIFNFITGSQFRVGNFPGVTVEKKHTTLDYNGETYQIIDLPGIYSFISRAPDEEITRNYLLSNDIESPDLIINVVDANNLDRNLYLTTSLIQLGKPILLLVTMLDVASNNGVEIDLVRLSKNLGLPVIGVDQKNKKDKDRILQQFSHIKALPNNVIFPTVLFQNVEELQKAIQSSPLERFHDKSSLAAFKILEEDKQINAEFKDIKEVQESKQQTIQKLKELFFHDMVLVLAQFRYNFIDRALNKVRSKKTDKPTMTQKLDKYLLHQYWGFPLFIVIIWFCFKVAVSIGSAFQDFFEITSGAIFVDLMGDLLQNYPFLKLVIADSIGTGIQALCTFIPVIFMVFVVMNLLEDTGYLARITVLVDRIMRFLGLPGKALAPLVMGFGCNVVSIFGTRILETPQERKISIAMSPFISCGARLPVYSLITLALFPNNQGGIIASLYLVGIFFSILTAFILSRLFFKSSEEYSFLLLEMPEFHFPNIKMIFKISARRVNGLMMRAFKLVIVFMAIYQILDHLTLSHPKEGILVKSDDKSIIRSFGEGLSQPLSLMGVQTKSWPLAVGLINGLLAKEAVVGTLVVAFAAEDAKDSALSTPIIPKATVKSSLSHFASSIKEAIITIPHNLIGYKDEQGTWNSGVLTSAEFYIPLYTVFHPVEELAPEEASLADKIQNSFADDEEKDLSKRNAKAKVAAYAYLLFILLYTACVAVLSATNKELGRRWMWGVLIYQLFLAYGVAVLFYQVGCLVIG